MSASVAKPSLRARVVRNVMLPLALTWLTGTLVALVVAYFFTQQAFDRALLDDAYSVAFNVRQQDGALALALSPREVSTMLFDQVEESYFAVRRPDGSVAAGERGLHAPALPGGVLYEFADISYLGKNLRAVTLHQDQPAVFDVVMAQTTKSRSALLQRLLLYSVPPQVLLLLLLAWWLRRAIGRDLQPLAQLRQALDRRDASDLAPVPVPASTRDVQRLGMAVNALLDRVVQSVRAQREFAGNVAHELRTPLAGIRALAEYGLTQKDPQAWRRQLEAIVGSQARASHLVDQLLALALADEAKADMPLEPVRLDELVGQTVLRHLARADAQNVDLGARGFDDPVTVRGNAALIEGILDNLIGNALRYGGRTVTIELAGATLSVVDDGPGIAPDAQRDLVQRWAQGPAGEKLGQGAGLGLAIVARYAQLLGAELTLAKASASGGLRVSLVFADPAPAPLRAGAQASDR